MTDTQIDEAELRILVADDEPMNVMILSKLLKHCGLRCEIARDGVECVEKANLGGFDVILMDINMPKMDGVEATREIARRLAPKGPRVIAVTANATSQQRHECDEAGFAGFISKPVRLDALRAALNMGYRPACKTITQ